LKRGLRDVDDSPSLVWGGRVGVEEEDGEDDEVVSVPDVVDVGSPGLMSLVTGGLVLVIVSGVVVDDPVVLVNEDELEPDGSMKYCCVGGGSLNCLATVEIRK
jgi:hypothetical protein